MDQCKVTLMKVLLEPGENAGIIVPFWVTYPESVRLAHGIPCFLESDQTLRPDPARLRKEVEESNVRMKGGY